MRPCGCHEANVRRFRRAARVRRADWHRRGAVGFTLLEMIVVLAIMGLATAMVAPSMVRGIDSWRRQGVVDALLDQIRALPGDARGSGRSIEISESSLASKAPPLQVPDGWQLRVPKTWRVNGKGVCQGGEVRLVNDQGARTIRIAGPFCDPTVLP